MEFLPRVQLSASSSSIQKPRLDCLCVKNLKLAQIKVLDFQVLYYYTSEAMLADKLFDQKIKRTCLHPAAINN